MKHLPDLKSLFWPFLLVLITVVISFANYVPGTWLSGWDTLHPEFNFPVQIQNVLFGVWRADQGLGAVAAHSHMAELPRLIFLWASSFVLPLNTLRYFYIFICFVLGPMGVFFFLRKVLSGRRWVGAAAFLGGLFYIFNLGTVQHFYVPFEMFPTQYAALGWLFFLATEYISTAKVKYVWLFALVTVLALPMAYAALLWYAFFASLVLFLLVMRSRRGLVLILVTLVINSFWLLPNWYFLINHAKDVPLAKINEDFSDEAFLKNQEFGNLVDTAVFKNFLFDWQQNTAGGGSEDLLKVWKQHLSVPWVSAIGYLGSFAVIAGVFLAFKGKKKVFLALLPVGTLAVVMIVNANPPFSWIFDFVREHSSILRESLRFPFTKFSIILMFAGSAYFGLFWSWLLTKIEKLFPVLIIVTIVSASLLVYGGPMFRGFLIDPAMRVNIPQEYFKAFEWFKKQPPDARVAPFPVDSNTGWEYANWKYQGAGFFWFGIPQAFLARDFDRWMPTNENYYWEVSYALYSKNLPLLEAVLDKYRVNWLFLDGNIVNPSSPKVLYLDELESLIGKSQRFKLAAGFGKIKIYSFALKVPTQSFVSVTAGLPSASTYKWGSLDQAYFDLGDYVAGSKTDYFYRTLFTGRSQSDLGFDPKSLVTGYQLPVTSPYYLPELSHNQGYLITVESKNISGKPFLFWIENLNSRRADLETYLPGTQSLVTSYFVQPPMESDGLGYALHFDNNSIGREKAVNELGKVTIAPIDYWALMNKRQEIGNSQGSVYLGSENFLVSHPNPSFYRIDLPKWSGTVTLWQSFEPGWVGITVGEKGEIRVIGDHVLVNNWANGWKLTGDERIVYLFFWPQLLEFAGFGLLGTFFTVCLVCKGRPCK